MKCFHRRSDEKGEILWKVYRSWIEIKVLNFQVNLNDDFFWGGQKSDERLLQTREREKRRAFPIIINQGMMREGDWNQVRTEKFSCVIILFSGSINIYRALFYTIQYYCCNRLILGHIICLPKETFLSGNYLSIMSFLKCLTLTLANWILLFNGWYILVWI